MTHLQFRCRLRKLQKERDKIRRRSRQEFAGVTGEALQQLQAEWSYEFHAVQEQIDELQSDYVLDQAERFDVAIPNRVTGELWERMNHAGDRHILTTLGSEELRAKIRIERKQSRDAWGFYLGMAATIGSVLVALLAIYLRR